MAAVSIIYFSGAGHTAKMAEAVQKGAASVPGVQTHLISINGEDIVKGRYQNDAVFAQLDASDAIIFGSPTYMGGPAGQFKTFADATGAKWFTQAWRDKVAGGFTVSSSPSGDKLNTLEYFLHPGDATQHDLGGAGRNADATHRGKPVWQFQRGHGPGGTGIPGGKTQCRR